jgi:Zn-dependent protease with chaperone function
MKWLNWLWHLTFLGLAMVGPARSEDIADVLRRSQQMRLDAMKPATDAVRAKAIRDSFDNLRQALSPNLQVELRIISGGTYAETLHGNIVIANESIAELPEGERLFILAHELGHVAAGHWAQMNQLYKRWIPGAVTPELTNPVAGLLGRDASGLAHQHEYSADVFALRLLRDLGWPESHAYSAFLRQGMQHDTATHPGTRKRVASLRAAQAQGTAPSGVTAE